MIFFRTGREARSERPIERSHVIQAEEFAAGRIRNKMQKG